MNQIAVKIGPADHGRRMSLDDFEHAETAEGRLYELGRGVIIVSDVPNPSHLAQVTAIRRQLSAYDLAHPGRIYTIATGSECKILLSALDSERHPDLAVYRTPPPGDESDVWYISVPEVVSRASRRIPSTATMPRNARSTSPSACSNTGFSTRSARSCLSCAATAAAGSSSPCAHPRHTARGDCPAWSSTVPPCSRRRGRFTSSPASEPGQEKQPCTI